MDELKIEKTDGGIIFTTKVVPGSSRTGVCGIFSGMVKIKVSAAPEKGKANAALVGFLAKKLGVKKKCISIISGQTGAVKRVQVSGVSAETLLKRLACSE